MLQVRVLPDGSFTELRFLLDPAVRIDKGATAAHGYTAEKLIGKSRTAECSMGGWCPQLALSRHQASTCVALQGCRGLQMWPSRYSTSSGTPTFWVTTMHDLTGHCWLLSLRGCHLLAQLTASLR